MSTTSSSLNTFMTAMETIEPSRRKRNAECFSEAYEEMERHLSRKVTFKVILATFNNAYGSNLSPARFRQLLTSERKRRQVQAEAQLQKQPSALRPAPEADTAFAASEVETNKGDDQ